MTLPDSYRNEILNSNLNWYRFKKKKKFQIPTVKDWNLEFLVLEFNIAYPGKSPPPSPPPSFFGAFSRSFLGLLKR